MHTIFFIITFLDLESFPMMLELFKKYRGVPTSKCVSVYRRYTRKTSRYTRKNHEKVVFYICLDEFCEIRRTLDNQPFTEDVSAFFPDNKTVYFFFERKRRFSNEKYFFFQNEKPFL